VEWDYAPLTKLHVRYQSLKTMSTVPQWQLARQEHFCEKLPARIHLVSDDPDVLKGVNVAKMAKARKVSYPILRPYIDRRDGMQQWCIAAVPGEAWAKKVFPGVRGSVAVEKLWEAILSASRVDGDPVAAWDAHNKNLATRCAWLNGLKIRQLHYYAENGTDLTVGMIPEARFCGGCEVSRQNITFNPNIPSEECFISPKRGQADGIVHSTMPLSYQGQLIENFWLRFQAGKVVGLGAEKNEALLRTMLTMDEGASMLGECALVGLDSPIWQRGHLFYNTLFDENAACHLALGTGFPECVRGYEDMTKEQLNALGLNDSMLHVDFMIGDETLEIDGLTADGTWVPLFRQGDWVE
jgi:aminopeptidase